jgi:AraC-like DNA-binding protein
METKRPKGRKDYQLVVIVSGGAVFHYNDTSVALSGGDMIIVPPYIRNEYYYKARTDVLWLHFSGTEVPLLALQYGLEPYQKYRLAETGELMLHAGMLIKELQLKRTGFMHTCAGYLLLMLMSAKRRIESGLSLEKQGRAPDLTCIVEDIQSNYAQTKEMADYAQMCSLSVSRFAHLFTERYHQSPHSFRLEVRISQAKYLLKDTLIPVQEIARNVGYQDPLYFSRLFKKHTGASPTEFRENAFQEEPRL